MNEKKTYLPHVLYIKLLQFIFHFEMSLETHELSFVDGSWSRFSKMKDIIQDSHQKTLNSQYIIQKF